MNRLTRHGFRGGLITTRRQLRAALRATDEATSYTAWHRAAVQLDTLLGLDAWRADDESPHYDAGLIRAQVSKMRALREADDPQGLFALVHESLYRHLNDLAEQPRPDGRRHRGAPRRVVRPSPRIGASGQRL